MKINASINTNSHQSKTKNETSFKGIFSKTANKSSSGKDTFVKPGLVKGKEMIKAIKNGNDMIILLSSKDETTKVFKTNLSKTIHVSKLK